MNPITPIVIKFFLSTHLQMAIEASKQDIIPDSDDEERQEQLAEQLSIGAENPKMKNHWLVIFRNVKKRTN